MSCPFCNTSALPLTAQAALFVAFHDKYPISPGHTLIVPRRHVASYSEFTDEEARALLPLVAKVQREIEQHHSPSGYNIGWNDGASAGQTVFHFHLHVIPRYDADVSDPRGGIRWIMPDKAKYWDE